MKRYAICCLLICGSCVAQLPPVTRSDPNDAPVLDAPMSNVHVNNVHQVLPNGKKKDTHSSFKEYRDAMGRTRYEYGSLTGPQNFVLVDRPARVEYWWNNVSKICMFLKLPAIEISPAMPPPGPDGVSVLYVGSGTDRHKEEFSDLPPKTILGMETRGSHWVKYAHDNVTVVSTTDSWYVPELQRTLYAEMTAPKGDHWSSELKEVKRGEQKASIFLPPKGYTLQQADQPETEKFE